MAPDSPPDVKVVKAFAAAIVSFATLPEEIAAKAGTGDQKFVVHPHIGSVPTNDPLLLGYLRQIYASAPPLATDYPRGDLYKQLAGTGTLRSATKGLAANLSMEMSKKRANAGILFGFLLERSDGSKAHGVIKADLDHEQRFHMTTSADGAWSYSEVSELLPHPRTDFAKYVIAPQPNGVGKAGIRDTTTEEGAAYFLAAVDLSVPKTRGTRAVVASVALKAGYALDEIKTVLDTITEPTPVTDVAREHFPRIPEKQAERLAGRPERPMPNVMPDDPFIRTFKTRLPYFELSVDESVTVSINGRVVTVTLPPGDPITPGTREQR
ncbi:MAG: hypothetical protein M3404_00780 [Actinomycetota bacterium]|nr:hypothetical protein [Actinomycetota bacterium]